MRLNPLTAAVTGALVMAASCSNAFADGVIQLYEHTGQFSLANVPQTAQFVSLKLPPSYRFGSTKNASKAWVVQLLTFYPSVAPALDDEHRDEGLKCVGLCNGRILISVEFRPNVAKTSSPNMADFVIR